MADLNILAPNYLRAQQKWPSAPMLETSYKALYTCFSSSQHGLVEYVKSFIESVCRTIIGELGAPLPSSTPSTTELLGAALGPLGLRNTKGASNLDKVLSGFIRLSEALGEMRNEIGPVAHGRDGFLDSVSTDHARAFLHAGDAILGVLLSALEGKQPNLRVTREPYESFPYLNERIDRAVSMEVRVDEHDDRPIAIFTVVTSSPGEALELRIEPRRLLYGVDREAYVEVLKTTELVVAEAEVDADEEEGEVAILEPVVVPTDKTTVEVGPVTTLVPAYSGILDMIRPDLEAFLVAEDVKPAEAGADADQLVDSLLATAEQNMGLDWKNRDQMQARLKVACKRVFTRFGYAPQKADTIAKQMVVWLCEYASDVATDSSESSTAGRTR